MQISDSTQSLQILLKIDQTCLFQFFRVLGKHALHKAAPPVGSFFTSLGRQERYPRVQEQRLPPHTEMLTRLQHGAQFFPQLSVGFGLVIPVHF